MSELPTHVTRTQMQAAAKALGLDPATVTFFQVDAGDGVIVVADARDATVRPLPAMVARYIPIGHGPDGDQW